MRARGLSVYGRPCRYDVEQFAWLCFLFEVDGFHATVKIELSPTFPEICPTITLLSAYRQAKGRGGPVTLVFKQNSYPYSPRWPPAEMAARMRTFLQTDAFPNFVKTHKNSK